MIDPIFPRPQSTSCSLPPNGPKKYIKGQPSKLFSSLPHNIPLPR